MSSSLTTLWDATPETVATLRRFGSLVGGVDASEYDEPSPPLRSRLERDLRLLLARGVRSLWVDEPMALGGFGLGGDGDVRGYNEDSLRFFRMISLLQDAELLGGLSAAPRRTVWEIGGGWGGFAHQCKTVCPEVVYLITGAPDSVLLSAVYLMTTCPDAQCRFFDPAQPGQFWHDWDAIDFAFAPESVVDELRPPSLELTIDVMALQRMSPDRVDRHVRRAHSLESRYLLSVCPSPEAAAGHGPSVYDALQTHYWRHPMATPWYLADRLLAPDSPTYFLGWRRLRA